MTLSWMAWTWPTAAFFGFIALCLVGMMVWEWRKPGGDPRRGERALRAVALRKLEYMMNRSDDAPQD